MIAPVLPSYLLRGHYDARTVRTMHRILYASCVEMPRLFAALLVAAIGLSALTGATRHDDDDDWGPKTEALTDMPHPTQEPNANDVTDDWGQQSMLSSNSSPDAAPNSTDSTDSWGPKPGPRARNAGKTRPSHHNIRASHHKGRAGHHSQLANSQLVSSQVAKCPTKGARCKIFLSGPLEGLRPSS